MRILGLAGVLPVGQRRAVTAAVVAMTAIIAGSALHTLFGLGGSGLDVAVRDWATSAVYVLVAGVVVMRAIRVKQFRGAWISIGIGISLYGAGNLVWSFWLEHLPNPPIPSVSDVLWLSLYPASYLGVALLARRHWSGLPAGVWLDGVVAALAIAALGAALVFGPVLHSAVGNSAAVATNLAYPLADLLLAALVVGVLSLQGWRLDRCSALLGGGFLVLTVADSIYLTGVAGGADESSAVANILYMAAVVMIALAAWQPPDESVLLPSSDGISTLLLPGGFALAALGVLAYDHFHKLGELAFVLALVTVLAGLLRTALAFRDLSTFSETRRQAITDDLTGLPNRRLFLLRLNDGIARGRDAGLELALLIVDLDHFKELNDTLGHHSGDELLRQIGPRLSSIMRPADTLARLGGDEFGIVLGTPSDESDALAVANRIRIALGQPFDVQDLSLRVDASVGIALYPAHADNAGDLLRRADVAMYQAKSAQSRAELYDPERDTHSRERLTLAAELENGLRGDEIEVHFQPKADALTGEIVGVEALTRWRHPSHGLLLPDDFVSVAATTGLMRSLTRRVLKIALAQCAAWRAAGFDLGVSVNVAVADLLDVNLPAEIAAALALQHLPPSVLVIEVTENSVLSDPARIHDVLASLDELGVGVSLDDFGTGFSSLGHLRSLPVGEVKIDRSFVTHMGTDDADAAIVYATIRLAHTLGKRVVAEGVESEETWRHLATVGCDLVQGFALSSPVPADELAPLLERLATRNRRPLALVVADPPRPEPVLADANTSAA